MSIRVQFLLLGKALFFSFFFFSIRQSLLDNNFVFFFLLCYLFLRIKKLIFLSRLCCINFMALLLRTVFILLLNLARGLLQKASKKIKRISHIQKQFSLISFTPPKSLLSLPMSLLSHLILFLFYLLSKRQFNKSVYGYRLFVYVFSLRKLAFPPFPCHLPLSLSRGSTYTRKSLEGKKEENCIWWFQDVNKLFIMVTMFSFFLLRVLLTATK
jgi:hypothetical protein